ncbi:MAG: DUF4012 domain-containing protein [Patescibacteria group bacterium]
MAKVRKRINGKNGLKRNEQKIDFVTAYVPKENIVNLKEVAIQKEIAEEEKTSFFSKWRKTEPETQATSQTISRPARSVPLPKPVMAEARMKPIRTSSANLVSIRLPLGWPRSITAFILVCLILVSPLYFFLFFGKVNDVKGKVMGVSFEAYDHLQEAQVKAQNLNIDQAKYEFIKATDSFKQAQEELYQINSVALSIGQLIPVSGGKVKSGAALLKAGKAISEAGSDIATAIAPLMQKDLTVFVENQVNEVNLVEALIYGYEYLRPALLKLKLANQYMQEVELEDIPAEYRDQIKQVKDTLPKLDDSFDQTMNVLDVLLEMLGKSGPMRYLVVFQNNHEMRASGGFIGSFALIDIDKGKIAAVEVPGGGPYEINTFLKEKVIAPGPLHLVNPHWFMQDSNWFPDWPESAKKITWFYENSGGPSVDGVLALTPTVIEELLKITGPITMTQYEVTVDAENFVPITQNIVEVEYDKEANTPKQFIADLLPVLLEKVFAGKSLSENAFDILKVLHQSLNQKFILINFQDAALQEKVVDLGWAGQIKAAPSDYLMVNNTNVAGGKTDGVIDEIIEHQSVIQPDGSVINTVTVKRIHHGVEGDPFSGVRNVNYIRFYVPQGSQLLEIDGYEKIDPWRFQMPDASYHQDADLRRLEQNSYIDDDSKTRISEQFGKTVFGNWIGVAPGESATITIKYKLPFKINQNTDRYSLLVQKQPGSFGSYVISEVSFPTHFRAIWAYPDNRLEIGQNKAKFEHDLTVDQFFGLVFKK